MSLAFVVFFFFQAEDGIRDKLVTGVQTCALLISNDARPTSPKNTLEKPKCLSTSTYQELGIEVDKHFGFSRVFLGLVGRASLEAAGRSGFTDRKSVV